MKLNRESFEDYLNRHPDLWSLFVRYTFELLNAGHNHGSADAVCHRIRWQAALQSTECDDYKVNNNLTPWLARHFGACFPDHAEFFRKRPSRADRQEDEDEGLV